MRKSKTTTTKATARSKQLLRHKPITHGQKLLFKPQVLELLGGIAYSTLWGWMKDGWFPLPLELGPPNGRSSTIAWDANEVLGWIANRPRRPIGQNVHAFRGRGAEQTIDTTHDLVTAMAVALDKPKAAPPPAPYVHKPARKRPSKQAVR